MRLYLRPLLSVLLLSMLSLCTARADVPSGPPTGAGRPGSSTLVVSVHGLQVVSGTVIALLFPSEQGFPAKVAQAAQRQSVKVESATAELRFPNLTAGTYAVTVYQDQNDNGKLDTNWIGIPKEPVGASNNPRPRLGPPRFDEASVNVSSPEEKIAVNLVRP